MFRQHANQFASASLAAAVLALYPSIALFTPAVGASVFAAAGAVFAILRGAWRRGVVTLQLAAIAIIGSPLLPFHRPLDDHGWLFWEGYLGGIGVAALTGGVLYARYYKRDAGAPARRL